METGPRRVRVVLGQLAPSSVASPFASESVPAVDPITRNGGKGKETPSEQPPELPEVLVNHPLDPLTPKEIASVVQIVEKHAGFEMIFQQVALVQPSKVEYRKWSQGANFTRVAECTAIQKKMHGAYRASVDLVEGKLTHWEWIAGARAPFVGDREFVYIYKKCFENEALKAAMAKRGLDMTKDKFHIEPWPACNYPGDDVEGRSILNTYFWQKFDNGDNHYAHPIEGINVFWDRVAMEVIKVEDHEIIPIPQICTNWRSHFNEHTFDNHGFKPLEIEQPEGSSVVLDNRCLSWHQWSMHIGWERRAGLVLSDIQFYGRKVLYSACIAEMTVPYGNPHNSHNRKMVFDIGEFGFGPTANSLRPGGCDCKGSILYLDAWHCDGRGKPVCIKNAICIHEEDHGVLWKHTDFDGHTEVRRARRLVISSIHTVGNYEYGCYWYFMMDGTIQFDMKATGIITTVGVKPGQGQGRFGNKFGTEITPGVFGMHHQHLFTARLDWALDGDSNSLVECDTRRDPMGHENNPYGNTFYIDETLIRSESNSGREKNDETSRFWKVINPNKLNAMGRPVAYKMDARDYVKNYLWEDSPNGKRQLHTFKALWVTAHDPKQEYPAGDFLHNSDGSSDGVWNWVKADRPLDNKDIVVWLNFGLHHITRQEDWPVQPCVTSGFMLHPVGFFDKNPCLDVAPPGYHKD